MVRTLILCDCFSKQNRGGKPLKSMRSIRMESVTAQGAPSEITRLRLVAAHEPSIAARGGTGVLTIAPPPHH